MNKLRSFSRRALSLLTACMLPLTGAVLSAPSADAAGVYITQDTVKSGIMGSSTTSGSTKWRGRSIAKANDSNLMQEAEISYNYTGKIYVANSDLYDYRSDNEINGGTIDSKAVGYEDPYKKLNYAISEDYAGSPELLSPASENLTIKYKDDGVNRHIRVYLYNSGSNANNGWPGKIMNYDAANDEYFYTIKYSDLSFVPDRIIITGVTDSNGDGDNDSRDEFWEGKSLSFSASKGTSYYIFKDNITTGTAYALYKPYYTTPLYFGCFYEGDYGSDYNAFNKGPYNNFYWQANMSLREQNFDASVQGLVDSTLKDGTVSQDGKVLPYFSTSWADNHSDLVEYWQNVTFPFYEIKVDADKVHGDGTGKAVYYQFNSKEQNLYFDQSKEQYVETTTAIKSQPTTTSESGTDCFLPFNNSNNYVRNNLGFGTKFDIQFQLQSDGMVQTVDGGTGKVNATFEFMGDDDVWVFMDGKLVLDLGGDHKDTTGIIDFAEKTAYANDATKLGYNSRTGAVVGKDNIYGNITKQMTVDLREILPEAFDADGNYDESITHTLTMFYMERGMYESDLLVRFNFATIPNRNTLKVKEVTTFENVNEKLRDLTKKAADDDVFRYTVTNDGTAADDVSESGIMTPTLESHTRVNQGLSTKLTGQTVSYDTTHIYLDAAAAFGDNHWTDGGAKIGVYVYGGGKTAKTILGTLTADGLYRFDTEGYTGIDFMRISKNCTISFPYNGYLAKNDGGYWDRVQFGNFTQGATYKITGWSSATTVTTTPRPSSVQSNKNFDPNTGSAVKDVSYIWKDMFATSDEMTNTTDSSGAFHLMYGTEDKESSAEFRGQFKKGSTMTVEQVDDLRTVLRNGANETFATNKGRTVSEYYTTTVEAVDKGGYAIDITPDNSYAYQNTANVPAKESVQITETFTNTPKVGTLKVTKTLTNGDTNVADTFSFQLTLSSVFGIGTVNVTDYTGLSKTHTISSAGIFTLKGGETMVIEGIPYGTQYTVTELSAGDNYTQTNATNTSGTIFADTVTIEKEAAVENTRRTNDLTLQKEFDGDVPDAQKTTPFSFDVVLTAPTGVNLGSYIDVSAYTYDGTSYSRTFTVVQGTPVTISGLPYGTAYQVSEQVKANWTIKTAGTPSGTIGAGDAVVTITNSYDPPPEFGSLTIRKNVKNADGSEELSDTDKALSFSFTVLLTDDAGANVNATYGTVTFVNGKYECQLKDDESLTISNIPAGYHYRVTETEMTGFEQIESTASHSGVIEKDVTKTALFTNQKNLVPYVLPEAGMEDARVWTVLLLFGMMAFGMLYWYVNRKKIKV